MKASAKPRTAHVPSDKDQTILRELQKNPAADSPKQIAEATKIPASTVTKRLRKLRAAGYISTAVNLREHMAYRALISIDLDLIRMKAPKHGYTNQQEFVLFLKSGLHQSLSFKRFISDVFVEEVYSLLGGRADVCVIAASRDVGSMFEFVTRVIHALPGVKNTNTSAIGMAV